MVGELGISKNCIFPPTGTSFAGMSVHGKEKYDDQYLLCPGCQIYFNLVDKVPKYLSCMHTVCLDCITKLSSDGTILCPVCSHPTLSGEDKQIFTDFLPSNLRLTEQIHRAANRCDNCEVNTACMKCLDCESDCSLLCEVCTTKHKTLKAFKSHCLIDMNERSVEANGASYPICPDHPARRLDMHCTDCHSTVCLSCAAFGHKSHTITSCSDRAHVVRTSVRAAVQELHLQVDTILQTKTSVEQNIITLNKQKNSMLADEKEQLMSLLDRLHSHERVLSSNVNIQCEKHRVSLQASIDYLMELILFCRRLINAADSCKESSCTDRGGFMKTCGLLAKAADDIERTHSLWTLPPPLAYSPGSFNDLQKKIAHYISCHSSVNVSDRASEGKAAAICLERSEVRELGSGLLAPSTWRLLLLLTLRPHNFNTDEKCGDDCGVTCTSCNVCSGDFRSLGTCVQSSFDEVPIIATAVVTNSQNAKSSHLNCSTHVTGLQNGTYFVTVSVEMCTLEALRATSSHRVTVNVRVFGSDVQGSPFGTMILGGEKEVRVPKESISESNSSLVSSLLHILPLPAASFLPGR